MATYPGHLDTGERPSLVAYFFAVFFKGLAVLALGSLATWAYWHYVWQTRMPQELTLTDSLGAPLALRLEGRNGEFVKATLLRDQSAHYYPIALFSPADQLLLRRLPNNINLKYPLTLSLVDRAGGIEPVSLEGHNEHTFKFTRPADHTVHYAPIATLPLSDQALLNSLPSNLSLFYPLDYTLADTQGLPVPVRLVGRTQDLVAFSFLPDESEHVYPIGTLAAEDQKFIRDLPVNRAQDYPIERVLSSGPGQFIRARIDSRTLDHVRYHSASDGAEHLVPIESLAAADQEFVRLLPLAGTQHYPLEFTFTDPTGKPLRVLLMGRSESTILYNLPDGSSHYFPIARLNSAERELVTLLPTTAIGTPPQADTGPAKSDTTAAPVAALPVPPARKPNPMIKNFQERIAILSQENQMLEARIAKSNTSPNDRNIAQQRLKKNNEEIISLGKQLNVLQGR